MRTRIVPPRPRGVLRSIAFWTVVVVGAPACAPAPPAALEGPTLATEAAATSASSLEGVALGDALTTVLATCKARGWSCTTVTAADKTTRLEAKPATASAVERLRVILAAGAVVSVSCRWASASANRYSTLAVAYGHGMRGPRGETVWPLAAGTAALRMGATGRSATLMDVGKLVASGLMGPGDAAWTMRPRALSPAVAAFLGVDPATMGAPTKTFPGSTTASVILGELPKPMFLTDKSASTLTLKLANRGSVPLQKGILVRARPMGSTAAKTLLTTATTAQISPGKPSTLDLTVDLSKVALPVGPIDLEVELDGVLYPVPAFVSPQLPELEVTAVAAPEALAAGQALPIAATVRNSSRFPTSRPFSIDVAVDGAEPISIPGGAALAAGEARTYRVGSVFAPAYHGQSVHVRATVRSSEDLLRFNNGRSRFVRDVGVPPPERLRASERIPFTLTVTKLRVIEENDGWLNEDDVALQVGADTTFEQTGGTNVAVHRFDVDLERDLAIAPLRRNYLRKGEKLLFQVTALEEDFDVNELETAYLVFDPDRLSVGAFTHKFRLQHDDEIVYDVSVAWSVGAPEASNDLPAPVHRRPANEYAYEGNYRLFVDGLNGGAPFDVGTVRFLAEKAPAHPWGRLRSDDGCLVATTQLGRYVELGYGCADGPLTLHGQLTRDGIVGTTYVSGAARGFALNRVP
jgi:hypothetical protein